ncbi:tripartite tricarboxylate transporter substrate binding protein [Bordetella sp. BOR01]|uniref:tripartite tricarboxylate transporter substrate binding protein n=1 Tax=Bordetella sp. BOR01 TaxID=2854779 RepID=UPI001C487CFB|nr:tripartite tricarboxylate transporter substrate binding protein [Bordetella sp. BOR01]MBV7485001.1 tripartite tricarboxylate transporter substrate binding protein [Bordetella sp. BOR01]
MDRRRFCAAAGMAPALLAGAAPARAQSPAFNNGQPIVLVVPFSPGGNLDTVARAVAPELGAALGMPVVIENKPGAGGVIGASLVARAAPDGHTLLVTTPNAITVAPFMVDTDYTLKNFAAVGGLGSASQVVAVNPKGRFQTMAQLLDEARRHEDAVTVGHSGLGTTNHIALLRLEEASHCHFTAVPFKGSAPAITALLGGQIDAIVDQVTSSYANIRAGKLRGLAVLSAERDRFLPDVPTLAEAGVGGFTSMTQSGLVAPAGTPSDTIKQLNAALNQALQAATVRERLHGSGSVALVVTPGQWQRILAAELETARALDAQGKLAAD